MESTINPRRGVIVAGPRPVAPVPAATPAAPAAAPRVRDAEQDRTNMRTAHAADPIRSEIERAFGGPVPLADVPNVSYGSYGTWTGVNVLDTARADVCLALAAVRAAHPAMSRRTFTLAANVRSPKDLDAAIRAAGNGRGARWVVAR